MYGEHEIWSGGLSFADKNKNPKNLSVIVDKYHLVFFGPKWSWDPSPHLCGYRGSFLGDRYSEADSQHPGFRPPFGDDFDKIPSEKKRKASD